jgi:signal peptidase I
VREDNAAVAADRPAQPPVAPASAQQRGFIAEWAVTAILLLFGTTSLLQAFVIPTGSMENSLLIGDHLLVDKMAYAPAGAVSRGVLPYTEVKRGDVIVFRYPVDIQQTFVKRCIGIPGDRIKLVNKRLWLNGHEVDEPYVFHQTDSIDAYRDNFPGYPNVIASQTAHDMLAEHVENGEVVVPPGRYFAMGDNRDASLDSRYWGFVPRENIVGKPIVIYWSYDAPTGDLTGSVFNVGHLADMILHFPAKTRWSRTFRFIRGYPLK